MHSCHGRWRAPGCFGVLYYYYCYYHYYGCFFLLFFGDGMGWGGMLTFMFMLRWWCHVDHGVGWGGMLTFMFMLRWWCHVDHGVGWGGMLTFMFMLRWWCYVDHGVGRGDGEMWMFMFMLRWWCYVDHGVGWGGVGCQRSCSCYADDVSLIMWWGGVGWWGGMLTFMFMLNADDVNYVDHGVLASQGSSQKKGHWWLSDPLLETVAKGLAMDVAQNKAARQ